MIPEYQTLMRPVLACAAAGETRIGDAVDQLAVKLGLTLDERAQSQRQANYVRPPRALGQDIPGQGGGVGTRLGDALFATCFSNRLKT